MARKPRLEWEGASYHVMARGNERARIFKDEGDYCLFLKTLQESLERFGVELHAWVLMPNHYHLAASTPRADLSRWMAWLQTTFTARYNRRHRRVGHLFQGRYRAEIVDADAYARHLVLYIHLNPIRRREKGLCEFIAGHKELESYRWSGHMDLAGLRKKSPVPLSGAWTHYWSGHRDGAKKGYQKAVMQALRSEPQDWKDMVQKGLVVGGPELLEKVLSKLSGKKDRESVVWKQPVEWEQRRRRVEKLLKTEPDRRVASWVRVRMLGEKGVVVAEELGYKDGSGVTQAVKGVEKQRKQDPALSKKLERYETESIFKG